MQGCEMTHSGARACQIVVIEACFQARSSSRGNRGHPVAHDQ